MPKDKVEIIKTRDGEYAWHRKAGNGEIISQGETHARKADCVEAAARANPDTAIIDLSIGVVTPPD